LANCLSGSFAGVFDQSCNAIRWLRAIGLPVLNAISIQNQSLLTAARQGIKETQPLDITTVATVSAISNYNVIKRAIFGATSGQTNAYHLNTLNIESKFN
jgi:hypothetical protein